MKTRRIRPAAILTILLAAMLAVMAFAPQAAFAATKKKVYVISEIRILDTFGQTQDDIKYTYNKNGLVSKRTWRQPGGSISDSYRYDKQFHITKVVNKDEGEKSGDYKYTYKDGRLTKAKMKYLDMASTENMYFEYNKKGQLKGMDGSNTPETSFKYNKKGLLTQKSELYNYPGAKPSKTTYKYDKHGNVTKIYNGKKLDRIYKNSYVKGTSRLKSVTVCYGNGTPICTAYVSYKKVKVEKEAAKAAKKQQISWACDPVFTMFPM